MMRLLRLYLSEVRFHCCQWQEERAVRTMLKGMHAYRQAQAIRRRERLFLGLDDAVGLWRPPTVDGHH